MAARALTGRRMAGRAMAGAALVLALAPGCGPGGEESVDPEDPSHSSPSAGETVSGPAREAVADLARRLDVPTEEVELVSMEEVTWRDGSIGCAEEGKMYTQALVDGHRIILRAAGETHEYHSGGPRGVFRCEEPTQ